MFWGTFTCPIFGQAYIAGTPKLQKIADTAPSANRAKGFNPGTASGSVVYAYDKNGNLTTDPYKSITIQYNFLNLPRLITKGGANISIRYDATGRKWSQTGTEGIREYVGGIEYVDQKVQSVQHGEGRLVADYNASGTAIETIRAEYWRQDHLGNTRVAFSDFNLDGVIATKDDPNTTGNDIEITQENHYYPFGLNHEGPWYQTVQPKNKYQYNGKEYVEDLGLNWNDYGARWYDAAVGRFIGVDPIADAFPYLSVYNYASNDPVSNIDLHGLQGIKAWIRDILGVDVGKGGINSGVAGNDARKWHQIENSKAALSRTEKSLEKVADVQETLIPLGSTLRKGLEGDSKGAGLNLVIESATEVLGAGVAAKVAKRVPTGELWVKIENFVESALEGQKPGTFVDEALDAKGGYIKFGRENTDSFKPPTNSRQEWIEQRPNTAPKSRFASIIDLIFGGFDPPGM